MSDKAWLITMGSWEDRFTLGLDHIFQTDKFVGVTILYSQAFLEQTACNREKAKHLANNAGIELIEVEFDFADQIEAYLSLEKHFVDLLENISPLVSISLDISTMPREIIWNCFTLCEDNSLPTRWSYFPPENYSTEWLTKEPDVPRMILRKSGITQYGKQTAIVIVTGFDSERAMKSISYFEPSVVKLGVQIGEQYENLSRNAEEQKMQLKPELCNISMFDIDAYSIDHGVKALSEVIDALLPSYNVLLTSQGPKPSAIAAYQIASSRPAVGLFYIPALEYSPKYSSGIRTDLAVQGGSQTAIGAVSGA